MIHRVQGDLLKSDCNFIGHQSNCLGGFGGGIAGQIRKQVPEMYEVFSSDMHIRHSDHKLGSLCYTRIKNGAGYGFNLYGQYYFGGRDPKGFDTDYAALKKALHKMLTIVPELARIAKIDKNNIKVGLPWLIGCGLAGGDWDTVYALIEEVSDFHKIDIYLYEFTP